MKCLLLNSGGNQYHEELRYATSLHLQILCSGYASCPPQLLYSVPTPQLDTSSQPQKLPFQKVVHAECHNLAVDSEVT